MTATFNNRTLYTINLFDQVYSSDKKDDLKLKQAEHKKVIEEVNKQDPTGRTSDDMENDRNFLNAEEARIMDLRPSVIGNMGFHTTRITHMDVCAQRPIICTGSTEDQTVRLWNYMTFTCELMYDFKNLLMNCVALHPSGYFMAVAFDEHVKVYHVLF